MTIRTHHHLTAGVVNGNQPNIFEFLVFFIFSIFFAFLQIVDKTILFADKDEDGKVNFEEFCEIVGNTDVHKKMVVDV